MNIFATHKCPIESAQYLWADNPKRAQKMIVEGVQLMSTALNKQAGGQIAPYKSAPGPTVLIDWTAQSQAQFMWVHEHTKALALEYYRRTKKQHKSFKHLRPLLTMALTRLKDGVLTGFVNYAKNKSKGLDYTHMQDVHKAYRLYLQQQSIEGRKS